MHTHTHARILLLLLLLCVIFHIKKIGTSETSKLLLLLAFLGFPVNKALLAQTQLKIIYLMDVAEMHF